MSGRIREWLEGQRVYEQIQFIKKYKFDRNDFYKKIEISISSSLVYFVKLFNEGVYDITFPIEYSKQYSIDNDNANNNPIYATLKFLDRTVSDQYISKLETYEFMSKYKLKYHDYVGIEDGWLYHLKNLLLSYNNLDENSTRFVLSIIKSHWCTVKNGMSREESEEIRLDEKYRIINDNSSNNNVSNNCVSNKYVPENGTPSKGKYAIYSLTNDSIRDSIKDAMGDQLTEDDINKIIDGFKPMKIEDDSDIISENIRSFKEEIEPIYCEVIEELDYERSKEFIIFYSNHSTAETAERFHLTIKTVYQYKCKIMKKYPELIDLIDLYDEKEDETYEVEESNTEESIYDPKEEIKEFLEYYATHTSEETANKYNITKGNLYMRKYLALKKYPEFQKIFIDNEKGLNFAKTYESARKFLDLFKEYNITQLAKVYNVGRSAIVLQRKKCFEAYPELANIYITKFKTKKIVDNYKAAKEFIEYYATHTSNEIISKYNIAQSSIYSWKSKYLKEYPELESILKNSGKVYRKSTKDDIVEFVEFSLNHTLTEVAEKFNISYSAANFRKFYYKKHYPELFKK